MLCQETFVFPYLSWPLLLIKHTRLPTPSTHMSGRANQTTLRPPCLVFNRQGNPSPPRTTPSSLHSSRCTLFSLSPQGHLLSSARPIWCSQCFKGPLSLTTWVSPFRARLVQLLTCLLGRSRWLACLMPAGAAMLGLCSKRLVVAASFPKKSALENMPHQQYPRLWPQSALGRPTRSATQNPHNDYLAAGSGGNSQGL